MVYQDEFVNWVKTNYAYGQTDRNRRIYFQLDNEPDIWAETHPEVHPDKLTYAELLRELSRTPERSRMSNRIRSSMVR